MNGRTVRKWRKAVLSERENALAIGQRLRDIAIKGGCTCQPTPEYAEYSTKLESALAGRGSFDRLVATIAYQYEGKMVAQVCDVCQTVNDWDDMMFQIGLSNGLT